MASAFTRRRVLNVVRSSYDTARLFACAIEKKSYVTHDPVETYDWAARRGVRLSGDSGFRRIYAKGSTRFWRSGGLLATATVNLSTWRPVAVTAPYSRGSERS